MLLQRQQSRRRGYVRPAALPCPPYAPLSWAAIVGRRTGGEEMLVMRPLRLSSPPLLLRWKGTPSPTQKQWITRNGYYAAKFWHPQKKASTSLHRGPKCRCFAALSWGTGRSAASHAGDYTTAQCRQCVVQRENLWFSTLCTFSQRAKAESLETQRGVLGKKQRPQRPARAKYSTVLLSNRIKERNKPSRPPERRPRFDSQSIRPRGRN